MLVIAALLVPVRDFLLHQALLVTTGLPLPVTTGVNTPKTTDAILVNIDNQSITDENLIPQEITGGNRFQVTTGVNRHHLPITGEGRVHRPEITGGSHLPATIVTTGAKHLHPLITVVIHLLVITGASPLYRQVCFPLCYLKLLLNFFNYFRLSRTS